MAKVLNLQFLVEDGKTLVTIGHFRVNLNLNMKARLSAKFFLHMNKN